MKLKVNIAESFHIIFFKRKENLNFFLIIKEKKKSKESLEEIFITKVEEEILIN